MNSKYYLISLLLLWVGGFQGISQELLDSLTFANSISIQFDLDQSALRDMHKSQLDSLLISTKGYTHFQLSISGHTDGMGSDQYNMKLSAYRSKSVVDYLMSSGIPIDKIISDHHGERRQLVQNGNEENRLNRRVEIECWYNQKFIRLQGQLVDKNGRHIAQGEITLQGKKIRMQSKSDSGGMFDILAPLGQNIEVSTLSKNHFYIIKKLTADQVLKIPTLNFILPKLDVGKTFIIHSLNFHGNLSVPLDQSLRELNRLQQTLILSEEVCFELAGHINLPNRPKTDKNNKHIELSVARALLVRDSMMNAEIDSRRMVAKGYSNWHMIYPQAATQIQQAKNRSVEIHIRDCKNLQSEQSDFFGNRQQYYFNHSKDKFNMLRFQDFIRTYSKSEREVLLDNLRRLKSLQINPLNMTYSKIFNYQFPIDSLSQ